MNTCISILAQHHILNKNEYIFLSKEIVVTTTPTKKKLLKKNNCNWF